jgi:predicted nucleotidyltransferase
MKQFFNDFIESSVNTDDFVCIYVYGSHLYNTNTVDSDIDLLCIFKEDKFYQSNNENFKFLTIKEFQYYLNKHDIKALEVYFIPDEFKYKEETKFNFILDKWQLRKSLSEIVNNSWVKGKKKLTVLAERSKENELIAIKSIFHVFRILSYGIQIVLNGNIQDYSFMNYILTDIKQMNNIANYEELWKIIESKFSVKFKNLHSDLKKLCPKNNTDNLEKDLIKLFVENDCYNQQVINTKLISKIFNFFNNLDKA